MSGEWINWWGGDCPVAPNAEGEIKFSDGKTSKGNIGAVDWEWRSGGRYGDIVAYRLREPSEQSERADVPEAKLTKHPHYHKDVSKYDSIDVYRVLDLFGVTDQSIGHAAKKLLVAGGRGHKDIDRDIDDVIDTLERWKEMRREDENATTGN